VPPESAPAQTGDLQIQLRRGTTAMTITWPMSAATDIAAWMRELQR
jgi:transposase